MRRSFVAAAIAAAVAWTAVAAPRGQVTIIDSTVGDALEEAVDHVARQDFDAARAVLATVREQSLSPYDLGRIERLEAEIAYRQGDPAAARAHLENALASGGLNADEQSSVRYQIGHLYLAEARWQDAAATLEQWLTTASSPDPAAHYALGMAYYQLKDYERASSAAESAVTLASDPPASWLELVAAVRLERGQHAAAVPWLERLVEMQPQHKDYWLQLSSAYQVLGQYDRSLAVMQLAYAGALLTGDAELRRLADLLLYNGLPYRAAEIIERAIAARGTSADADWYALLAEAWVRAGELDRAVPPLERAAEQRADGSGYVRLAELHVERRDWRAALAALDRGLERGDLADPARAALLKGAALVGTNEFQAAREWLERAAEVAAYRPLARQYLEVIDARARPS